MRAANDPAARVRAVVFDLDGTLLDTIEDIAAAMNAVLRRRGYPLHKAGEYVRFVGEGMDALVRRALPAGRRGADAVVAECARELGAEYASDRLVRTHPYPGVAELLDFLSSGGFALAILSNKPDESARENVARFLPRWRFAAVAGARPGVPLKPDPASAIGIARSLSVPPHECVFVGDSGIDMRTARAAGMVGAGALWGFRTEEELVRDGAQILLRRPDDLRRMLEGGAALPPAGSDSTHGV